MDRAELERTFETMARTAGARALGIAAALLGSRAGAEDAVQESFERAYRSLSSFRGEARMETWFLRIVINTAYRHARRGRWFKKKTRPDSAGSGGPDRISREPTPEQQSGAAQIRRRLTAAIGKLPRRQRTAFVLRYVEEMSTAETADLMECAPGTVKASLYKAVTRLRGQLKDLWAEETS
jgi:RNA polymerase sigma-70 factor (ECF subfamily)